MSIRDKCAAIAGLVVFAVLVFFYFGTLWAFPVPVLAIVAFVWEGIRRV